MDLLKKLEILTDSAKYDVACTSSGVDRPGDGQSLGSAVKAGICHAFAADGRCISLLKVLLTNVYLQLQILREPRFQRCAPRSVHAPRTG